MSRSCEKRCYEVSTSGFDPSFQLRGSSPAGTGRYAGQIIPATPSTSSATRYLFALAGICMTGAQRGRIRGIRQALTIGATTNGVIGGEDPRNVDFYNDERPVVTPFWRFSDASVSWHLRRVPSQYRMFANKKNANNKMYRFAQQNALLYETLDPYSAPWGGNLPGEPVAGLGGFHDIRFPWEASQAWNSCDIPIEGPASYVLFASVWQTDPQNRNDLTLDTTTFSGALQGQVPEEQFVFNTLYAPSGDFQSTGARYWRIAGSLIVEEYVDGAGR